MKEFALWLSTTGLSVFIQEHYAWAITLIQTVHIAGIAVVFGSAFLMILRILSLSATDLTLRQVSERYSPWLNRSLYVLLVTGLLLLVGEPVREIVSFSFWAKMFLVATVTVLAVAFQRAAQRDAKGLSGAGVKALAVLSFVLWVCIIFLGRFIAYDHVWGSWSPGSEL